MPSIGPIKRRDLIRYLRQLGFEVPILAAGTNIWSKRVCGLLCRILTEAISAAAS